MQDMLLKLFQSTFKVNRKLDFASCQKNCLWSPFCRSIEYLNNTYFFVLTALLANISVFNDSCYQYSLELSSFREETLQNLRINELYGNKGNKAD